MRSRIAGHLAILLGATLWLAVNVRPASALTDADRKFLEHKIIARWQITGKNDIAAAYARGIDVLEDHPNPATGYFTIMVNAEQLVDLQAEGFKIKVEDYDWYRTYASKVMVPFGGFRTWAGIIARMDSIHAAHPSITTAKFSIGLSYEGKELWAMKISDNPGIDENEPEVFFNALTHAREPIGGEILLETMRRLTEGYGVDTFLTRLVNEREIWFLPCANPDGYVYNQLIAPNGGGQWRKNRNDLFDPDFGVDLNRNYGFQWGYDDQGSSPDPPDNTYRGTAAFSEPETQAVRAFVNGRDFVFGVNYHSYSNLYLWAWGYIDTYTPDDALFQAIGDSLARYNNYVPQVGWKLYNTNGDADDWAYGATTEHAEILSFTPEVGSGGDGFWPNPSRIPTLVAENQGPNLVWIDLANAPERIYPPVPPTWVSPNDTISTPDFTLVWSDPGGPNAAVSYRLDEHFGGRRVNDDAESITERWVLNGFSQSLSRSASGDQSYYGGFGNGRRARLTAAQYLKVQPGDSVRLKVWWDIETDFDYAYVEASADDGQTWITLPGNITTTSNPWGNNRGNGITGYNGSGGVFLTGKFPLNAYVGQSILVRLSYETDGAVLGEGVYFDDIAPVVEYDSVVTIDPALASTSRPVTGKTPGTYAYSLGSTDAEGQHSGQTAPHEVIVDYTFCDCSCHSDPACDGVTDVFDVTGVVAVAFRGGDAIVDPNCPHGPAGRTDVNCDGQTNVLDVVATAGVAFRNGNPATAFCDPCAL